MNQAWGRAAAMIVAACVMFAAGGCGTSTNSGDTPGGAAPTTSKAPDPKELLLGSLKEYDKGVFSVDFTGLDGTGSAAVDSTKKQAYLKMVSTDPDSKFTMEFLLVEPDAYVKANLGELAKLPGMQQFSGKTWLHIDRTKIKDADRLGVSVTDPDMLGLKALLQSANSVQAAGDKQYKGTLDLAKGENTPMTDEDVVKALADKAAAVPFTATLDAQGRLTGLLIDVPAAGDKATHQLKLTVTQYGTATIPAKPTGKAVVEASPKVYEFFNS
jgi:hypothetical protein